MPNHAIRRIRECKNAGKDTVLYLFRIDLKRAEDMPLEVDKQKGDV